MKHYSDKKGKIEKYIKYVIKHYRPELSNLTIRPVWRDEPKFHEGSVVFAEAVKVSNRDRDLYGIDGLIIVDHSIWKDLSKDERKKLIYHELKHFKLEFLDVPSKDEEEEENLTAQQIYEKLLEEDAVGTEIKRDKEDRVKFKIVPHDIDLRRFKTELLEFGLSTQEEGLRQFLNYVYKKKGLTE